MIDTPTRRVVLGAGVFAAGSWLMIDGSAAQAPLAPRKAAIKLAAFTAKTTQRCI